MRDIWKISHQAVSVDHCGLYFYKKTISCWSLQVHWKEPLLEKKGFVRLWEQNRTEQKIVLFFHFYSYSLKYLNDTPLAAAKFQYWTPHFFVFESVIAVAFQSVFYLKIHQNNIYFLKIYFDTSTSKWSENTKKILI
jgi:hypothetical protein